ncbi:MAG: FG-GAP-like repeat-containing protein [Tannerella sp.]|nr:FG-GAP-like repeat-containing protein [Tannerella sp.]
MNTMNTFLLPFYSPLSQLRNGLTKSKRSAGLLCLLLLLFCTAAKAQVSVGDTEFWFVAPDLDGSSMCPGPGDSPIIMLITNNSTQTAHVNLRLYNGGSPMDIPRTILPGDSWRYDIPDANKGTVENPMASAGIVTDYGIHITSDVKVTAYYQIQATCNQDLFALKGKPALGTFFYVPMIHDSYYFTGRLQYYPLARDQIDIVATENGTEVRVVPTADIRVNNGLWTAGDTLVRTLDKGQTLKIMEYDALREKGSASLGGTSISATHPVAVTTAEDLIGDMINHGIGYDVIGDQIVPVSSLGKRYVVIKGYNDSPERVYMIATEDGTVISVNDGSTVTSSGTLDAGDCWMFDMGINGQPPAVITVYADSPFYCYQVTGDVRNELGSALLPDVYAVSQTQVSFYSYYNIFLSLLFRTGSENDFTLSYGSVSNSPVTMTETMPVPGMPEWTAAKYTVSSATQNSVVTIKNTSSMFGLGCFVNYPSIGYGTSYGYLSSFQTYELPDTTWKCAGTGITLDAGYGASYEWTLPDGSTSDEPTIIATDTGLYTITIIQNQYTITETTRVLDRFDGASIIPSGINDMGAGAYTYSVDLNGQSADGISYLWRVDGVQVSTEATYTVTWTDTDEKQLTVEITDADLGCTQTLSRIHHKLPDNISDAACYVEPPAQPWSINLHLEYDTVFCQHPPLVGDLDGDGYPDLFLLDIVGTGTPKNFVILKGPDFDAPVRHTTDNLLTSSEAIARVKWDSTKDSTILIVTTTAHRLKAYSINGDLLWTGSTDVFNPAYSTVAIARAIGFADFNSDGYAEVYVGNQVFDAVTGLELCNGGSDNRGLTLYSNAANGLFSVAADVTGDRRLELCAGNQVYEVSINSRTDPSLNSMTVIRQVTPEYNSSPLHSDGATVIADFDSDGELEILVQTQASATAVGTTGYLYIWKPSTEQVLAVHELSDAQARNVPFVGDINGDGKVEIVVLTSRGSARFMRAFALAGNGTLNQLWRIDHTDSSGSTGLTLFDFNQDGIAEIVYRDETQLRIINGSLKSHITGEDTVKVYDLYATPAYSGTTYEYAVVADVDGDGHAEIITTSATDPDNRSSDINAILRIYKGDAEHPWAPARKVWNQYLYSAVNINEDLTVPRYQFNPATFFPGDGGTPIQPYNNFLQQQTVLSAKGTPLWLTPDALPAEPPTFSYSGDSLLISLKLTNAGDASLTAPFYVSAYKNTETGACMATDSCMTVINPGETVPLTLTVRNLPSYLLSLTNIIIRLNDRGESAWVQPECIDTNNGLDVPLASFLLAHNDHATTLAGLPVLIDVLANDTVPDACKPLLPDVINLSHGTAKLSGDSIRYTPNDGFTGPDTVIYSLACDGNTSTAYIYIYVAEKPDNISDAKCYVDPEAFEWSIASAFESTESDLSTYMIPVAGDLNGDSIPEIVATRYLSDNGTNRLYNGFYIYWGHERSQPTLINTELGNFATFGPAIARIDSAGTVNPLIVMVKHSNGIIYAYNALTGALSWQSDVAVYGFTSSYSVGYSLQFVDFSSDGKVELLAGNRIFDAATGKLLLDLGDAANKGFSLRGPSGQKYVPAAGDLDGDGKPEYAAGNQVYSIHITNNGGTDGNTFALLASITAQSFGALSMTDGPTLLADINEDGRLDVFASNALNATTIGFFAWDVQTQSLIAKGSTATAADHAQGIPFVGNVDTIQGIEILFTTVNLIKGFRYNRTTAFEQVYQQQVVDGSGSTGITLFDFNQDGKSELVYRDETHLRIMQAVPAVAQMMGTFKNLHTISGGSGTVCDYPIVVDVDNDGSAEIVTIAGEGTRPLQGTLRIYKSDTNKSGAKPWAPARKVWNQYSYNAVNINEDLTVPQWPLNPATVFPGRDSIPGTADDVQPFNNFLQQQTALNADGIPFWPTPDAVFDKSQPPLASLTGDSVSISLCIVNQGDAALGSPVYATLYKDSVKPGNIIATDSLVGYILPGDTDCLTVGVRDINPFLPFVQLVIRLNDNGALNDDGSLKYPAQDECDCSDSIRTRLSPVLHLMMKKDATLNEVQYNGTYPNPVSVLYTDVIEYTVTAVNANLNPSGGTLVIRDTLPAYLDYAGTESSSPQASFVPGTASGVPQRSMLEWTFTGLSPLQKVTATFGATPASGVSASQPMFVNRAWITAGDTLLPTANSTYHQGAGVSLVTFSAPARGGVIYNATPQALDFRTSPRTGILVVPEEGYRFAGWSHDSYTSLRGERIEARTGITHYDTLTVYGSVELRAAFAPEEYPVRYHLHGGEPPTPNPSLYTVESPAITLAAPQKTGDPFTGWTGANGDDPQLSVIIPPGSTGERDYYANYLYSGRETVEPQTSTPEDKIWASGDDLYVRTSKPGAIIRIYTPDGVLHRLQTIITAGETRIKLPHGIYIVTLNNNTAQKVIIEK